MTILISAVGLTDPLSYGRVSQELRDGPLVHIARMERPDKILLVYSEETIRKKERVEKVLAVIPDYEFELLESPFQIENDQVARFDRMYEVFSQVIQYCRQRYKGEELLLNLSSGTPQMIGALFALNRINDLQTKAVQVLTPEKSYNKENRSDDKEIEDLILENKDHYGEPVSRLVEDHGQKFNDSLKKRTLRDLIQGYDYQAAYRMSLESENGKLTTKKIRRLLEDFDKVFRTQDILQDIQNLHFDDEDSKIILNYYLMIDILLQRQHLADVLIKLKSLAEFILESYIKKNYPNLLHYERHLPKLNPAYPDYEQIGAFIQEKYRERMGSQYDETRPYQLQSTMNFLSFGNVIAYYDEESPLLKIVQQIQIINEERNKVAHGLKAINSKTVNSKRLTELLQLFRDYLEENSNISGDWFNYFDRKNQELCDLLR